MAEEKALVTIREAIAQTGLHRATIYRDLKRWPDLRHGARRKLQIDVAELRARRRRELDPVKVDNPKGGAAAVAESETGAPAAPGSNVAAPNTPAPGSFAAIKSEIASEELLAKCQARLERERLLLPRAEVETAFANCGRTIRRKIELIETWADDLAGVCGGVATALRVRLRELLRNFQTDLASALATLPTEEADDADDEHGGTDVENRAA